MFRPLVCKTKERFQFKQVTHIKNRSAVNNTMRISFKLFRKPQLICGNHRKHQLLMNAGLTFIFYGH